MANLRNYKELREISEIAGLELVTDSSHITLKKGLQSTPTWTVSYWTQGDVDELTDMVDFYSSGIVSWDRLCHYEDSMRDAECGYVVDSYRFGKEKMSHIVETALKDCGYSKNLLSRLSSLDFNHTSARLYGDIYITPSMIAVCVRQAISKLDASQLKDLAILIDCEPKKLVEVITDDAWNNLGETSEALENLDLILGV